MDLKELQEDLGYYFKDEQLLITALTHSSWVNENDVTAEHNERLEFLGDAVLEICISEELFKRHPEAREGELTRMRSNLVNTKMLVLLARELKLNQSLTKEGDVLFYIIALGKSEPKVKKIDIEKMFGIKVVY